MDDQNKKLHETLQASQHKVAQADILAGKQRILSNYTSDAKTNFNRIRLLDHENQELNKNILTSPSYGEHEKHEEPQKPPTGMKRNKEAKGRFKEFRKEHPKITLKELSQIIYKNFVQEKERTLILEH